MRNNGKIKEIQISLMLSSRTEMQRVIEQARAKSYAVFMQSTPARTSVSVPAPGLPLPAAVPPVVPSAIPEIKKEPEKKLERKDGRRRSRSKSRDRRDKDRSRDRDRKDRRRERSRSRSRDRKSRRRDRSRSRNRSRSRDRDRRRRDDVKIKKPNERPVNKPLLRDNNNKQQSAEFVSTTMKPVDATIASPQPLILSGLNMNLDQLKRPIGNIQPQQQSSPRSQQNGFHPSSFMNRDTNVPAGRGRESWPPAKQNESDFPTNRMSDDFGGNSFNQFPPTNRFQRSGFQGRGNRNEEAINCCIALEPFFGSYSDLRRFFSGLFISSNGIKFINNAAGKRTGIAFVQFGDKQSKDEAMKMNGMMLTGLQVSINHLDDREYEDAIDRYIPNRNDDDITNSNDANNFNSPYRFKGSRNVTKYFLRSEQQTKQITDYVCLTIDDLPTYVKEQDILHMFALHPLLSLILTSKKKGGHIAYVKFGSKEIAKKAYEETSLHIIGGKAVTVRPCKDEEFEEINKQHDVNLNSPDSASKSDKVQDVNTDCLHISKLPQKTNDRDISDFFSDIGVIPTKIHLMSNNFGFTGEAYCEFLTIEEAIRASKKNNSSLGNSVISVTPIDRDSMLTILKSTTTLPPPSDHSSSAPPSRPTPPSLLGPEISPPRNFGGSHGRPPFSHRNFDGGYPPRGRGHQRFGPRGGGPRMRFPTPPENEDAPPGCTVYMKNVPYKAGTNEILEFFEGYHHTGNVSRRYNSNNTPSDEAKVVFFDPDEATRAIDELNKEKIWERQIFLRQE